MTHKKFKRLLVFILSVFLINNIFAITSFAETPNVELQGGTIVFTVSDTTATTGIRWHTVGFTVTKGKCKPSGGDPREQEWGVLWLSKGEKDSDPQSDGTTLTTFTLKKKDVDQALDVGGLEGIKEDETFYLHGIHQVTHSGKNYGGPIYTLPGIKKAEDWNNADDFNERFDIPVTYHGIPEPVEIEYKTSTGVVIGVEKWIESKWVKPGTTVSVTLDKTRTHNGKEYELYKGYIDYLRSNKPIPDTGRTLASFTIDKIQNRSIAQKVGGVRFVAIMKSKSDPNNPPEESGQELIEPTPHGIIAADYRNNEIFDVVDGIPTTEDLYINAFTNNYLMGYGFKSVSGSKDYPVNVTKKYNLTWETDNPDDAEGNPTPPTSHSDTVTVNKTVNVERYYTYLEIGNLDVYAIDHAKIDNYALPGGSTILNPHGYNAPTVDFVHSTPVTNHIKDPVYNKNLNLGSDSIDGGSSRPSVPSDSFRSEAEGVVPEILVKNDRLIFNGTTILPDNYVETTAPKANPFEVDTEEVSEDVLYESALSIDRDKTNGEYETTGEMVYKRIATVNTKFTPTLTYDITELDNVVIHTPTVCDAYILPSKEYNQMLFPDKSVAPLVLDRYFKINLPTDGEHRYINGYEYRDYNKYIERRQVKYPFDVYMGNTYIKANTWHTLNSDITTFYVPIWVDEGKYTIDFRSISINADANNGINDTETLANIELSNYVATDTIDVEVSGRIYGFNLYDISDYPIWENVFRQPKSTIHTGFQYPVGIRDQNGINIEINSKFTLPLINGNHPTIHKKGVLKTGYITRFSFITIGNMFGINDYIRIRPSFYYIDKHGNHRQEVDIYYSETFLDKKYTLVKMGGALDQRNKKALHLGDVYRSVPSTEITTTARIKGVTERILRGLERNVFTYMNIMIPESMRTFIGTNYTPTGTVPAGVEPDKITKSMQRWYGEYYIPSEVHVVPKGFNVLQYAKENGAIDYFEDIWLKDGYIIINFDIETIKNDARYLSYINPTNFPHGYCNMWNKQGYQYTKIDEESNTFNFQDGDYILYDTNQSAAIDYISRGTH